MYLKIFRISNNQVLERRHDVGFYWFVVVTLINLE